MKIHETKQAIKTYVIRGGRLTKRQHSSLSEYGGLYCLEPSSVPIDLTRKFNNTKGIVCDIGFGMGSSLLSQAELNPDYNAFIEQITCIRDTFVLF